ncbi:allophanate hydrolase [Flavivirga aquatica]|uniref:Allophanate hydrolase n=1 Tax=Flavivirga aquatica TaxID=1849968 RepID=A0A1E5TA22_9FLAO|nr:biotin-dependent carboxyltransferase family protein [Flavivirga aquatica]OEK08232.1 allophanate hydrolase [Flavivirga aquatica]
MIKILNPGFYSSIQDLGRVGYQQYGIPFSGVMDKHAAAFSNVLLGNIKSAAVIEMTMTGPTLQFNTNTLICISGANMNPTLNNIPVKYNRVIKITEGDILSFGKLITGFRSYLAVLGGFQSEIVMNSQSMYAGITKEFVLRKGDHLAIKINNSLEENHNAILRVNSSYLKTSRIEVFKGAEFNLLSTEQQRKLFTNNFTISKNNNRMAYQLEEPFINFLKPIITSPVLPGTVQLTPSGKLIILMRDCQTTGGYPRILQVKETGINILSQKFTGNGLSFKLA